MIEKEIEKSKQKVQICYEFVQSHEGMQKILDHLVKKNKTTTESIRGQLEIAISFGIEFADVYKEELEEFKRYRNDITKLRIVRRK